MMATGEWTDVTHDAIRYEMRDAAQSIHRLAHTCRHLGAPASVTDAMEKARHEAFAAVDALYVDAGRRPEPRGANG